MNRRSHGLGWDALGLLVFAVLVFPVFWMVSTAFKTDAQINSANPTWIPSHPTLAHFRTAFHAPYFWTDVKNTVIVVLATVGIATRAGILRSDRNCEVPLQPAARCSSC